MSGTDRDMLAAEYVLGTLEGTEREEARRLAETDPAFAEAVRVWQAHLIPLARLAKPAAPPANLWERIEAGIPSAETAAPPVSLEAARLRRAMRRWQAATGAALAIAAAVAGFGFFRNPPPTQLVALSTSGSGSLLLTMAAQDGALTVRPAAPLAAAPSGRDYELWALFKGASAPRALGVLPSEGTRLASTLPPGTRLMVSVEPKGGSPTGSPTGPVIYAGVIQAVAE